MGKSLKGKQLGRGITQRKDGLYAARYTDREGKRVQKNFRSLPECKRWLAEENYRKEHCSIEAYEEMTVETWFYYWLNEIKADIRYNTRKNYENRWKYTIGPAIGSKTLIEVTPVDCLEIIRNMQKKGYAEETMDHTRIMLKQMFEKAEELEIILKSPVRKVIYEIKGRKSRKIQALTLEEQKVFLEAAKEKRQYNQIVLMLQTGIRVGELIALTWDDIDWKNKILTINKTAVYIREENTWKIGPPKTETSNREIPLTETAVSILKAQRKKLSEIKTIPMENAKYVFLTKDGLPTKQSEYGSCISRLSKKLGITEISTHSLRHTYATRCIEAGMKPKVLQKIMGHSSITMTMDVYVDVTDDELVNGVSSVQEYLSI